MNLLKKIQKTLKTNIILYKTNNKRRFKIILKNNIPPKKKEFIQLNRNKNKFKKKILKLMKLMKKNFLTQIN